MRILIASDSWKESLSSKAICSIVTQALHSHFSEIKAQHNSLNSYDSTPPFEIRSIPLSDGGDGFLDSITQLIKNTMNLPSNDTHRDNQKICTSIQINSVHVHGAIVELYPSVAKNAMSPASISTPPFDAEYQGKYTEARYVVVTDSLEEKTIVLEMAEVVGLHKYGSSTRRPMQSTSYGVGQLIRHMVSLYPTARRILLGVGGTSTIDAGLGALQALGLHVFVKREGVEQDGPQLLQRPVVAADLPFISHLVLSDQFEELKKCLRSLEIATDVTNPFTGPQGAAQIFGPQKGCTKPECEMLDASFNHLQSVFTRCCGVSSSVMEHQISGSGAAGGLPGSFYWLLGTPMYSGTRLMMSFGRLFEAISWSDLVITGEGCFDHQSVAMGKLLGGIVTQSVECKKRVAVLCGQTCFDVNPQTNMVNPVGVDPMIANLLHSSNQVRVYSLSQYFPLLECQQHSRAALLKLLEMKLYEIIRQS